MKKVSILFAITFAVLAIALVITYVKLGNEHALLILHFDEYRGIDFFGSTRDVIGILLLGMWIALINFWLARVSFFREPFISYALGAVSILLSLLLFIGTLVIISIN